jgi:hypothetical protein
LLILTIWTTIASAVLIAAYAFARYKDPFHPLLCILPMFVFVYGYLPLSLIGSEELFSYVTEEQAQFTQGLSLAVMLAFSSATFWGAQSAPLRPDRRIGYNRNTLQIGALVLGGIGLLAWVYMVQQSGGLSQAFGSAYGLPWSDIGYIRDSVYLLLVALLILLSPQVFSPHRPLWWGAIVVFAMPWAIQGLLGARRGPTFVLAIAIGVSWYMARGKRPSLLLVLPAGMTLGLLMLFLVANRGSIYIGSDLDLKTDVIAEPMKASEANEYIFGVGCISASRQTEEFFWGRRLLAQFLVRPVPRAIWPNKYADFGVPELEQNAGVAGAGLQAVMGWAEVPGAAAAMVADMWVEFSWGAIPFAAFWGWLYGYCWKRATIEGSVWITQYVILLILSVYLVTQGLEPIIFRLLILSVPARWLWRRAAMAPSA